MSMVVTLDVGHGEGRKRAHRDFDVGNGFSARFLPVLQRTRALTVSRHTDDELADKLAPVNVRWYTDQTVGQIPIRTLFNSSFRRRRAVNCVYSSYRDFL